MVKQRTGTHRCKIQPPLSRQSRRLLRIFRLKKKIVIMHRCQLHVRELNGEDLLYTQWWVDFTRLQPPYSFSLLHCRGAIFSVLIFTQFNPFICTLKKKTLRTLLNSPRPQWKAKSECPALPVRRPRLNQTNASFDAQEGRARASPPPATALSIAHPALRVFLAKDFTAQHRISKRRRGNGWKAEEPRGSSRAAPAAPSPRDRRTAPGRESGGSLGGPSRPGLARAGYRGFCSRSPSSSPGEAEGASECLGRPGLGKIRGGCGSPIPPISRTYTKGSRRNIQSLRAEGGARPSQGSHSEGRREQPGRGRRRRSGREVLVGLRREGEMQRKRQREAGDGGSLPSYPTPLPQGPRERERQRLRFGDRIQGRCVFVFPTCSLHLPPSGGLSPPQVLSPPAERHRLSQGLSSGSPPRLLVPDCR